MAPKKRPTAGAPMTGGTGSSSLGGGGGAAMNFRPVIEKGRWAAKGTKPLPEPITVPEIFTKVIIHGCRRVLFIDPKIRLTAYLVLLFFVSLLSDYLPFPKTYFSNSSNIPNTYFVKFSWAWTFILTGIFTYLTSAVYCCGDRKGIMRHMGRLIVGTIVWFLWTNIFTMVEESTGQCILKDGSSLFSIRTRRTCIAKNGKWTSFDISGHSFLLIWCVFVMIEEAKAIIGWDGIKDLIRNEEHYRNKVSQPGATLLPTETSLNSLSEEDFEQLKTNFSQYDMPAKIVLILMTMLCILWDLMIIATSVYFHVMIEKVIGGFTAAITWFVVYRGFYYLTASPGFPGSGYFRYNFESKAAAVVTKSSGSTSSSSGATSKGKGASSSSSTRQRVRESDELPKFMGMPLYALRNPKKEENIDLDLIEGSK